MKRLASNTEAYLWWGKHAEQIPEDDSRHIFNLIQMKTLIFTLCATFMFIITGSAQSGTIPTITINPGNSTVLVPNELKSAKTVPDAETLIISKYSTSLGGYITVGFDRASKIVFINAPNSVDANKLNSKKPSVCLKECGMNCEGWYGCGLCHYACILEGLGY